MYNLATAAAATGINKSTVLRAIKAGRCSAQRNETGEWCIDPAEFHRVFAPLPSAATGTQQGAQQSATTDALVATLNKVIDDLRTDREHWRCESDRWRLAFENTQRLLPSLRQHGATAEATEATRPTSVPTVIVTRRSWWPWQRAG